MPKNKPWTDLKARKSYSGLKENYFAKHFIPQGQSIGSHPICFKAFCCFPQQETLLPVACCLQLPKYSLGRNAQKLVHLLEPGVAFCTAELKKASLKKSKEPLKTTRALFLAWSPAIRRVFFPTACGYWKGAFKRHLASLWTSKEELVNLQVIWFHYCYRFASRWNSLTTGSMLHS